MSRAAINRISGMLQSFLRACGIDPELPTGRLLLSLLFILPPRDPGERRHWPRYAAFFPHVHFDRLRPGDVIRIPLQLLWLALIRATPRPGMSFSRWKSHLRQERVYLSHRVIRNIPGGLKQWASRCYARFRPDMGSVQAWSEACAKHRYWDHPIVRYLAYGVSALLTFLCITTPFETLPQLIFVSLLWMIALIVRRIPGQVITLLLTVLSITASTRYLWWRVTSTLNWDNTFDLTWGIVLLVAEFYAWFILLLGYFETAWPLKRAPAMLPSDTSLWPTVDIFIPTYNEPLKVVKPTVYAAMGMDWPKEKINIYLLDDGHREEHRRFAEQVGIHYLTRPDNKYAKAGNLNHALTKSHGEFVAIFDCDHVAARSFLQLSMGWFLRDPKLALVQTPHHFYSADPFERNLGVFRSAPNEGELFYGLIQDGKDMWNASFFCGSCAVLKRGPLEEVGGIATETVTEDAHTALRLQRLGYSSAYLNLPQAAGLATESLSAHIGQRIRWARGMVQIFRLDNPFWGSGLKWMQRICYSNAMLHFLNGIPRLIFLTAPLAFLIFHSYIIYAPAISVALYVLPHLAHATITNSRIQGHYRYSFWAEIYETVLAWYIARPAIMAILRPLKGKFNVTAKGGAVDEEYFDWSISFPYLVLIGLNLAGFVVGLGRLYWGEVDEVPTVFLNLIWTFYNFVVLGAAASVALEAKQVRVSHRVSLKLAAVLHLANGRKIRCETDDFSEGGIALRPAAMPSVKAEEVVMVSLWRGEEELAFPARVTAIAAPQLRLRWESLSQEQEAALVQCTFARADAWVGWADQRPIDRPMENLYGVVAMGWAGYRRLGEQIFPRIFRLSRRFSKLNRFIMGYLPRSPKLSDS